MRSCRSKFLCGAGTALAALSLGAAGASAAAPAQTRLGTRAAIPSGAQPLGTLGASRRLSTTVTLASQDPSGLQAFVQQVSTPGSAEYHHYLSVAEFAQRFGATAAQVAQVRQTLQSDGLTLGGLSANRLSFTASGTARQISHAFAVTLRQYRLPGGRVGFAAGSAPAVPSSIASDVQGVLGLDSLVQAQRMSLRPAHPLSRPRARGNAMAAATADAAVTPCSAASSAGSQYGAYTPDQLAQAYSFDGIYSGGDEGAGTSVALYELEPHLSSDIAAYQSCMGTSAAVTDTTVDGGAGSGAGQGEAALDIEDVIGLAPSASIDVYTGPNSQSGAYDTYSQIITDDTSKVISTSWGLCEASEGSSGADSESTLFQEAASQGQSVFAAAGDSGADDCGNGTQAVDDPASQPDVTGVGGTTLNNDDASQQTVWNDGSSHGAGGGGTSTLWSAPSYQSSLGGSMREVPDVSADADENTGYVVYYNGSWTAIGGTSAAAPLWASLAALADSSCASPVGLANPALYSAPSSDFTDITQGNNSYDGVTGFTAGPGYDEASGLGTPVASSLVPALCG